jgi:hypothetical protein
MDSKISMLLSLFRCYDTPVADVAPSIALLKRAASSSMSRYELLVPQLLQNSQVPVLDSCVMPVRSLAGYLVHSAFHISISESLYILASFKHRPLFAPAALHENVEIHVGPQDRNGEEPMIRAEFEVK